MYHPFRSYLTKKSTRNTALESMTSLAATYPTGGSKRTRQAKGGTVAWAKALPLGQEATVSEQEDSERRPPWHALLLPRRLRERRDWGEQGRG